MRRVSPVPGRLRLTVLGCSNALPHPDAPSAGFLVEWEETAILLDAGQGVADRLRRVADPRRLAGVVDRPHARRPLPRPGGPALSLPVGRRRGVAAPRPSPAGRPEPARRPRLGDLGTTRLLRRRLRHRRVLAGRCPPGRAADGPLRRGSPLRAGVGGRRRSARWRAPGLYRRYRAERRDRPNSPAAPISCWSRRACATPPTTTTSAAT